MDKKIEEIRKKLYELRINANLTQKQLADSLKINNTDEISRIENGKRELTVETILKYSNFFKKDPNEILCLSTFDKTNLKQIELDKNLEDELTYVDSFFERIKAEDLILEKELDKKFGGNDLNYENLYSKFLLYYFLGFSSANYTNELEPNELNLRLTINFKFSNNYYDCMYLSKIINIPEAAFSILSDKKVIIVQRKEMEGLFKISPETPEQKYRIIMTYLKNNLYIKDFFLTNPLKPISLSNLTDITVDDTFVYFLDAEKYPILKFCNIALNMEKNSYELGFKSITLKNDSFITSLSSTKCSLDLIKKILYWDYKKLEKNYKLLGQPASHFEKLFSYLKSDAYQNRFSLTVLLCMHDIYKKFQFYVHDILNSKDFLTKIEFKKNSNILTYKKENRENLAKELSKTIIELLEKIFVEKLSQTFSNFSYLDCDDENIKELANTLSDTNYTIYKNISPYENNEEAIKNFLENNISDMLPYSYFGITKEEFSYLQDFIVEAGLYFGSYKQDFPTFSQIVRRYSNGKGSDKKVFQTVSQPINSLDPANNPRIKTLEKLLIDNTATIINEIQNFYIGMLQPVKEHICIEDRFKDFVSEMYNEYAEISKLDFIVKHVNKDRFLQGLHRIFNFI